MTEETIDKSNNENNIHPMNLDEFYDLYKAQDKENLEIIERQIDKLTQMNQRLLLVMGYGTSVMLELGKYLSEEKKGALYWFIEAVENIVYLDKPLPPMP